MRINPYATQRSYGADEPREAKKELGKDEFLKILAAQFKGQNPMEPLSDTEFIGQMAQFSSLEQLQNIGEKLDRFQEDLIWGQHLSLLDKEIHALTADDKLVGGIVTGVHFKGGQFQFEIDGREQEITAIISVGIKPEVQPVLPEPPEEEAGEEGGGADE